MKFLQKQTVILLGLSLCVLPSCGWGSGKDEMVDQLCKKDVFLINVLDKQYADDSSIAGSVNIPFDQMMKMTEADFTKRGWKKDETRLIFYCGNYACGASGATAEMMKEKGFKNVYAYEGGTAEWLHLSKQDPSYKVVGPSTESYLEDWENPEEAEGMRGQQEVDREYLIISAQQLRAIIDECVPNA